MSIKSAKDFKIDNLIHLVQVGLRLLLCPLGSNNIVIRTAW